MTQKDRDELKRLEEAATPGPWEPSPAACKALMKLRGGLGKNIADVRYANGVNDTAFIASARNAVPDLLAENQRMRELLANAVYTMKYPSKTGRTVTLQLVALIESFLAEQKEDV